MLITIVVSATGVPDVERNGPSTTTTDPVHISYRRARSLRYGDRTTTTRST